MRKSSPDSVLNGTLLRTWSRVNVRLTGPRLIHYVPPQPIFLTSEGNLCSHCSSELKLKYSAQVCDVNSVSLSLCL